jgi:hypothetical protein
LIPVHGHPHSTKWRIRGRAAGVLTWAHGGKSAFSGAGRANSGEPDNDLILDPLSTVAFGGILKAAGVETGKLPARSPNLNAYAERFVLSVRTGCLGRMIPLGGRST